MQKIFVMQDNPITILSTRPLEKEWVEEANAMGIFIDQLSFIETEPVQTIEVLEEIEQAFLREATVVFTSKNAVEAVAKEQQNFTPHWRIYCIGYATQLLVKKYFGEQSIAGTADSARDLAERICEETDTEEVIFFCGDQRRNELPDKLRSKNIDVIETVVYQTIAVPHKIKKQYHGILFFSPSAVESFFCQNKISRQTILFAIGETTAAAIRKYSSNKIIISNKPGKETLLHRMLEYFGVA